MEKEEKLIMWSKILTEFFNSIFPYIHTSITVCRNYVVLKMKLDLSIVEMKTFCDIDKITILSLHSAYFVSRSKRHMLVINL